MQYDAKHLTKGLFSSLNILAAAGAQRLLTSQLKVDPYQKEDDEADTLNTSDYKNYIQKVSAEGIQPGWIRVSSAVSTISLRFYSAAKGNPL